MQARFGTGCTTIGTRLRTRWRAPSSAKSPSGSTISKRRTTPWEPTRRFRPWWSLLQSMDIRLRPTTSTTLRAQFIRSMDPSTECTALRDALSNWYQLMRHLTLSLRVKISHSISTFQSAQSADTIWDPMLDIVTRLTARSFMDLRWWWTLSRLQMLWSWLDNQWLPSRARRLSLRCLSARSQ